MELAKEVADFVHEPPVTCLSKYNPLKGCECFAIKQKFRRGGKSSKTLTCFFIIMISSFLFLNICVFPYVFGLSSRKLNSNSYDVLLNNTKPQILNDTISHSSEKDLSMWGTDAKTDAAL